MTIVVLGGISAGRQLERWWGGVVGPGLGVDTTEHETFGFDWRSHPGVTTHDQACAIARQLDEAGIATVEAVIGCSYGGMVTLAFCELFPSRVEQAVVIGAAHEAHPMSQALRSLQRRVVELGVETGRAPEAMSIARGIATTSYRTAAEFGERFDPGATLPTEVERYLRHQGEKFARDWSPNRFLALSASTDLHRVEPEAITTPITLVALEGDALVPVEQSRALAARLGGPVSFVELATRVGHDAFLVEHSAINAILTNALERSFA